MSRFYRIEIGGDIPATFTSYVGGKVDPGALNVEIDVTTVPFATPAGNSFIRIWGVGLRQISQGSDYNNAPIKVFVGMSAGLPLAKPQQAGLICSGTILQAFGNWIGTDMTLDLIVISDGGATQADPKNIVLDWKRGTPLKQVIESTLRTAYPTYTARIEVDSRVVLAADESGYFQTIEQFARYLKTMSLTVVGGTYNGIQVTLRNNEFWVYDGSTQGNPIQVDFTDLVGQPTYIAPGTIQFNTIMRADINIGDFVKMPTTLVTTTAASQSQARDKSAFQGQFLVTMVRHVGNFRNPDGQSWITTFNAVIL